MQTKNKSGYGWLSILGVLILFSSFCVYTLTTGNIIVTHDPLASQRDTLVKPGNDFWNYACGGWFRANPIPPSESSNGIYLTVGDSINHTLHIICEDCSAKPGIKGSVRQKIGDFYASSMDTLTREKVGMAPLNAELKMVDGMKDMKDVLKECAHLFTIGCDPMFSFYISRDDKISSKYAVFIQQGGLSLPDRDYYLNTDSRTIRIKNAYVEHMTRMLVLSGDPEATAKAEAATVLAIETELAQSSRTMEDLRDPYKNYNKFTLTEFNKLSPAIGWKEMFGRFGLPAIDTVITGQPEFLTALNQTILKRNVADWKPYYKWLILERYAKFLGKGFEDEDFHFNHTIMTGSKVQRARWKRMVELTEGMMGDIVGQEYVAHYVPADTKQRLTTMGKNIVSVYADHLKGLDWMSETTKKKALHKLDGVVLKMGYPDKWRDHSTLEINRTSLVENIKNVTAWHYQYMLSRYGKPVDRTEWQMTPETYNAYYEPTNNEIVIPACNLIVPGFGKGEPDDATLYGVVGGSTMGHEITHGFDDQGCQYDEKGNLNNWWTREDSVQFSQRAKKLAEQFNQYVVLDSMHIRGYACLGENIADLGGVIMGYEAFKKTDQWKKQIKINGLTPDQRYFLAYAYSWMQQKRNESLAKQIMSDVHAPAQYRTNGPLSNISAFYTAFNLKPGDKMYREEKDRVKIW
jgi:putative endopeptidase